MFVESADEVDRLRYSGSVTMLGLERMMAAVRVGMTTAEFDVIARRTLKEHDCEPAFLGQYGFPATVCVSVNEVAAHGIPGEQVLEPGDVVHLDFGAIYDGMYTDAGRAVGLLPLDAKDANLIDGTRAAHEASLGVVKAGATATDYVKEIAATLDLWDLRAIPYLCGHGVGRELHEEPRIPTVANSFCDYIEFSEGQVLALEPTVTYGDVTVLQRDDGSFVSADGSNTAQFEDTVLVGLDGCEVLTAVTF